MRPWPPGQLPLLPLFGPLRCEGGLVKGSRAFWAWDGRRAGERLNSRGSGHLPLAGTVTSFTRRGRGMLSDPVPLTPVSRDAIRNTCPCWMRSSSRMEVAGCLGLFQGTSATVITPCYRPRLPPRACRSYFVHLTHELSGCDRTCHALEQHSGRGYGTNLFTSQ